MIRCIEVRLTIPDNEARTAFATLRRLGIEAGRVERCDLYRFDVEDDAANGLVQMLLGFETVYNPNKHDLGIREEDGPAPGEMWVDENGAPRIASGETVRIGGRALPGVRSYERFTAWRLFDAAGKPASAATVKAASDVLLCNPAFQKALL